MAKGTRLELTWVGKDERPRLEPRILLEDPARSHCAKERRGEADRFDNLLIHGDNLLALKALEHEYTGKVKCIYIDPPYNTGSAFTHYDDGIEHSLWLTMMRDRLEILRRLLRDDGSIWISLDDSEMHYCKVLCDEVFGRDCFVSTVIWERTTSARNDAKFFSVDQDYVLVYAAKAGCAEFNGLSRTESADAAYSNPDNDSRGPWREIDYKCAKSADERPNLYYAIVHPLSGEDVWPRRERVWAYGKEEHARHLRENLLWWGKTSNYRMPKLKKFLDSAPPALVPRTLWFASEVAQTRTARQQMKDLFPDDPFATPKPEQLLQRILHIATNPGDLVLDSFAGSGTTGAVAHKMGRRWIMVELGDHCHTHIVPRLKKVIDGEDPGGVTEATGWQGGGGFRYYELAPSLMERDDDGQWVISREYNPAMLVEAVCKHEGFRYEPSATVYWQQGRSTEQDFLYVTTQMLTAERLARLSTEVGPDRHLLVFCAAYAGAAEEHPNLTLHKLPNVLLGRCEWGRDDYSLKVSALGGDAAPSVTDDVEAEKPATKGTRVKKKKPDTIAQPGLFTASGDPTGGEK